MNCDNCGHELIWDSFLLKWVHKEAILGCLELMCNVQERSKIPFERVIVCGCTKPE